ncbi:MAG: hypothetical protein GY835_22530 [bacterium]|nr:hypothetical protein [bacterium]
MTERTITLADKLMWDKERAEDPDEDKDVPRRVLARVYPATLNSGDVVKPPNFSPTVFAIAIQDGKEYTEFTRCLGKTLKARKWKDSRISRLHKRRGPYFEHMSATKAVCDQLEKEAMAEYESDSKVIELVEVRA